MPTQRPSYGVRNGGYELCADSAFFAARLRHKCGRMRAPRQYRKAHALSHRFCRHPGHGESMYHCHTFRLNAPTRRTRSLPWSTKGWGLLVLAPRWRWCFITDNWPSLMHRQPYLFRIPPRQVIALCRFSAGALRGPPHFSAGILRPARRSLVWISRFYPFHPYESRLAGAIGKGSDFS